MEYAYANANAEPHPDERYLDDLNIDEDSNDAHFDDDINDYFQFNNETSFSGHPKGSRCGHHSYLKPKRQQNATSKV